MVTLEPAQDLLRHCQLCLGGARTPYLLYCKLGNSSCITLPTAIHGLVRFLRSVRTQLATARNDLEQVLRKFKGKAK